MRACIYNPYLDTLGGGERYTLSFANVLVEEGFDVDIAWDNKTILTKLSKRFGMTLPKNVKIVDDIKRGDGYDICFWVSDGSIPLLRAKKNFIHFQVPFKNVNGKSLLNKMKLFRVEKIICNSVFTKNVIDKEYGVKSIVLYPPVDIFKFKPKRKENLILYVGRFSNLAQNKGQLHLIKVFKKLVKNDEFKNWKLILAGGVEVGVGNFIETLKKKSNNYNVEIVESPDFKTLTDLYGKAKFFWSATGFRIDETIYPGKVEHFGISLVEAMAGGAVPIVYSAGGHREIIENEKNGFLWENVDELIEITKKLVDNFSLQRKITRESIKDCQKYSYEKFKKNIEKII